MSGIKNRLPVFLVVVVCVVLCQIFDSNESYSSKGSVLSAVGIGRDYDVYIHKSVPDEINLSFRLQHYQITTDIYENETTDGIFIKGAGKSRRAGMPTVPVVRIPVAVPDCDEVEISFSVSDKDSRENVTLNVWSRNPYPRGLDKPPKNGIENTVDNNSIVRIERIASIRNQRIAILRISPVEYSSSSRQLAVSKDIDITLTPVNPRGEVHVNTGPMESAVRKHLANGTGVTGLSLAEAGSNPSLTTDRGSVTWCTGTDWRDAADAVATAEADYLIVAANDLNSSLVEELAEHRANFNGFNVAIVEIDQIDTSPDTSSTPDTLRAFIKRVYDSESAGHMGDGRLGYVLILSDAAEPDGTVLIPGYYGFDSDYLKSSDTFYSLLSEQSAEDDYFADIYLGRIPVDTVSNASPPDPDWELQNVVDKITEYAPATLSNKRILMVSGEDDQFLPDFQPYFQRVIDTYVPGYIDGDTVSADTLHRTDYPSRSSYDEIFGDEVADRLEANDHWILSMMSHGAPYYIRSTIYPKNYDELQNSGPLPVVFTYSCQLGHYDIEIDNGPPYCCLDTTSSTVLGCYTPTVDLDFCDALAERMVLQENGGVAAFAYPRDAHSPDAAETYQFHFRSIFEDYAYSLGEILLSTRFYMFPDDDYVISRNLTVFGDPALNIVWENYGESTVDSTDLAITKRGISFPDAFKGKYADTGVSIDVRVEVTNSWHEDATNVPIEVWDGDPDDGSSSLLARDTLSTVPANGSAVTTVDVGTMSEGDYEIYVWVDTSVYDEPSYMNNKAFDVLRVYDYKSGFPKSMSSLGTHSVTIADVDPNESGKEILVNTAYTLACWAADGDSLWETASTTNGIISGFANGTPVAAAVYNDGQNYCMFLDSLLYVLDGDDGTPVDTVEIDDHYAGYAQMLDQGHVMAVADIYPGDGTAEVIFAKREVSTPSDPNDGLYVSCYRIATGQHMWDTKIGVLVDRVSNVQIGIGDGDGDGLREIAVVVSSYNADSVYVLDYDGDRKWEAATDGSNGAIYPNLAYIPAGIGDDDQVKMDLIATGMPNGAVGIYKFDDDGDETSWTLAQVGTTAIMAVGDIDNDGTIEIVASYPERVYQRKVMKILSSANGTVEATVYLDDDEFLVPPILADVDADSYSEIITVTHRTNGRSREEFQYRVQVRNHNMTVAQEFTFPYLPEYISSSYGVGVTLGAMPAVDDIDGDGVAELVFASLDSVLHVIELGSTERNEWAQRYHDPAGTSNYRQIIGGEYDVDVSIFGEVELITDAFFRENVHFLPGTDVLISDEDQGSSGVDTLLVEIRAYGEVDAAGTSTYPIRFIAWDGWDESTSDDDWWGIFVHNDSSDASGAFENCKIKNAARGIATNVDITIKDCMITLCDLIGISIAYTDSVYIEGTTISGAELVGINLCGGSTAQVTNCKIEDITDYGIEAYSGATLWANGTEVRDCDRGIFVQLGDSLTASAVIDDCDLKKNDTGLWVYETSDVEVTGCVIDSNTTNGIYCDDRAHITIEDNKVRNNTTGIFCYDQSYARIQDGNVIRNNTTGILCDYYSHAQITDGNVIRYNSFGIKCDDYSDPRVEGNTITSNNNGVFAANNADPDLGHSGGPGGYSAGNNSIHSNTSFHVVNLTYGLTIKAENNYWKGRPPLCYPKSTKISGAVDYIPALCSAPSTSSPFAVESAKELPTVYELSQNFPNPFNPTTTLRYQVPPPGGQVSIMIYNVRGQLVSTLVDSHVPAGFHSVKWNGVNDRGGPVASGVYFVQMKAPSYLMTKKLLLLK
jgi:parallel beta-helix repeat protein